MLEKIGEIIPGIIALGAFFGGMFGCAAFFDAHAPVYTYQVNCEDPYYKGEAKHAVVTKNGTFIKTTNDVEFDYPVSIKCEVITTKQKKRD